MLRLLPIMMLAVAPALMLSACQRSTAPVGEAEKTTPPSPAIPAPEPTATSSPSAATAAPSAARPAQDNTPIDGTIRSTAERSMSDIKHIDAVQRTGNEADRGANRQALPSATKPVPPVERRAVTPNDADRKLPAARVPGRGEAGNRAPSATPIATPSNPPRLPHPRITETPRN
ncbi:hypothetical protein ACMT1E_04525 [Sphingomonas flavalba]|uniref:hypothetical protein n=1 Tax=Sphingomonas flavalba TaxID=2559804 RepID=UPI0039E0A6D1